MKRLIYLIGYRGTGKTTVGRLLAERLCWDFVDADIHLEEQSGQTIKEMFAAEGEAGFRARESRNLRDLAGWEQTVIATGGGIILNELNRQLLRQTGCVVWLTASPRSLGERIAADPATSARRPNLSVGGLAEIEQLLRIREPLYRAVADFEIDTEGQSPDALAEAILKKWATFRLPTSSG
jgi:shikimate kinase